MTSTATILFPSGEGNSRITCTPVCRDTALCFSAWARGAVSASNLPLCVSGKASHGVGPLLEPAINIHREW
jgi:hypothetical protein